jgi:hypothetical protein
VEGGRACGAHGKKTVGSSAVASRNQQATIPTKEVNTKICNVAMTP